MAGTSFNASITQVNSDIKRLEEKVDALSLEQGRHSRTLWVLKGVCAGVVATLFVRRR